MNLKDTIRNTFESLFDDDDCFFIEVVERTNDYSDFLEDYEYIEIDLFDDMMSNYKASEIVEFIDDSPHFDLYDDYFRLYQKTLYGSQKTLESYDYKDYSFVDKDMLFDDMFYMIKNNKCFLEEITDCIQYYPFSVLYDKTKQELIENILTYPKQPQKATA